MSNDVVLGLVVVTALGFDFTNGFHDTGNAMATSIATRALNPRLAVALSGVLNLVGAFLSLAHGTNDAQKTMGVIALALIANGTLHSGANAPFWVIVSCELAISIGTYVGGWRVIRTLGKGLVEIEPPQGMAAESSSAAVILASSQLGFALSTTHVATGSVLGSGIGKPGGQVRWRVAGRMVIAWLITLPAAVIV